jgi:hypothetical protein
MAGSNFFNADLKQIYDVLQTIAGGGFGEGLATEETLLLVNGKLSETESGANKSVANLLYNDVAGESISITLNRLLSRIPATTGQKTMANSLAVTIASDQGNEFLSATNDLLTDITTQLVPYTLTRFRSLTVDSAAQAVKGTPGKLYGWNIVNLHSSAIYVKFYNEAAATVNPATAVPIKTLMVPALGTVYQAPECRQTSFATALSVRAVTGSGDTNTTAPTTLPIIEIEYQ